MFFLIIIFLIITFSGFVITRTITKEQDSFILLPVSQITGSIFYIFILNIVSKIFHGQAGILISSLGLVLFVMFIYLKYRNSWVKLTPLPSKNKFVIYLVIMATLFFSALKMFTIHPAADSSMQWAYAAVFSRGNYPLMTPWQPDLTPNYHMGAYFLEGALFSLTGATFLLIHTVFNTFLLWSGSLMVIFLIWKRGGNFIKIWSIFAVLTFFVSFGVIVSAFPNFSTNSPMISLIKLRESIPAKGEAEASLVNLNSLSFLPARSLSIGLVLLALYFTSTPFKNRALKILSVSILLSTSALVEESMFIPLIVSIFSVFLLSFFSFIPRLEYLKNYKKFLFIILFLTILIAIFQGGFVTDNIFRTKRETPAFRIFNPLSDQIFFDRLSIFKDFQLKSNLPFTEWLVLSPFWILLILFIHSYIRKDPITGIIGLFASSAFAVFLATEYIYCSGCSIRIHSFGYIALGFGIFYVITDLLKKSSRNAGLIFLSAFTFLVLLPTLTSDLIYQNKMVKQGFKEEKIKITLTPWNSIQEDLAKWAKDNIPANERFLVIDNEFPSPAGILRFQFNGLYTILGPEYIRVNRPEPGMEFYDAALTLNPTLLSKLKTNYLYIDSQSTAYKQLPDFRRDDLNNKNFFEELKSVGINDSTYRILKVLPAYLDEKSGGEEINEGRIDQLIAMIPKGSSIYLSDYGETPNVLNFWYRMPFAYVFGTNDYDLAMNISQTTYQVIETTMHRRLPNKGESYDFYILPPTQKPAIDAELIWSNIYASGWKKIN